MNGDDVTYFDSFGGEYVLKEIKYFLGSKNIITNIYRIQESDSIMRWYFYIGFIDFLLNGESLLDSTKEYEKNDKIILECEHEKSLLHLVY